MRVLGLVTARGGSKGFPGKNVALLAGRPLVAWSHRLLSRMRALHPELEPWLSTDAQEIAEAWPMEDRPRRLRPPELACDDTTSWDVVEYELRRAETEGPACDAVLLLQPTSPLLALEDLEAAWQAFVGGCPSVAGATRVDHPVQWSFYRNADGSTESALPHASVEARQLLRAAYLPAGFWINSTAFLRQHRTFFVAGLTRTVEVPDRRASDIDHAIDLEIARCRLRDNSGEPTLEIEGHKIGIGAPVFVIAEAGVNHNGSLELAMELVDAAARAGADAVKFQTFEPRELVTREAAKAEYQIANTGTTESQREMLERLALPESAFRKLKTHSESVGLVFLSSPFDTPSARLLERLGVSAFKLGSGELTNHALLADLARIGRPLLLSTGMATLDEIEDASAVIASHGAPPVVWLHCVSSYPAPYEQTNLRAIETIRLAVGGPVGMSDHSPGWEVTLGAVALGARVIEKHLTLSRELPGPDHAASLEPADFRRMVEQIRRIESALGNGIKAPAPCELNTRQIARKSLVGARDLPAGTQLQPADLAIKRPGTGLSPSLLSGVAGRVLRKPLAADEQLTWEHLR